MTVEAHAAAFLAQIKGDAQLAPVTFEGNVTNRPARDVSVFAPSPADSSHRFTGPQTRQEYTYVTHSVGTSPAQARWVNDRLRARLLGVRLVVAGRTCWPIKHPTGLPMDNDTDLNPSLYFLVDEWELISFAI
jgi:hypothetical protein